MKRLFFVLCAALAMTVGVSAAAAGTTVGQTATPADTYWFGSLELVTPTYVVPAGGGLMVSLNTQSASSCNTQFGFAKGTYNLQVLRPLGGNQYLVLGDTGDQTDPCDGQLHAYPVHIPVQAGDVLGVYVVSNWVGVLVNSGSVEGNFQSEPAVGDIVTTSGSNGGVTVDESGTLAQVPTSTADCKNGGWKTLVDANGNPFKNQGDCVSYVATKGKNPGNG